LFSVASVCLFVCQFVCQRHNFRTVKRIRWCNLTVSCVVHKSRLSSNLGVKGQRSMLPGTKKTKKCGIFSGVVLAGAICVVRHFYAGGKISASCFAVATFRKNFRTDLHEIFREGWQWANEQTIKFWWRSGSRIRMRIRIRIRSATLVRRALSEVRTVLVLPGEVGKQSII